MHKQTHFHWKQVLKTIKLVGIYLFNTHTEPNQTVMCLLIIPEFYFLRNRLYSNVCRSKQRQRKWESWLRCSSTSSKMLFQYKKANMLVWKQFVKKIYCSWRNFRWHGGWGEGVWCIIQTEKRDISISLLFFKIIHKLLFIFSSVIFLLPSQRILIFQGLVLIWPN